MNSIKSLFKPKSIAIIGVSEDPSKLGSVLLSNLIESKYEGEIYPINPKYKDLYGYKVYKSISEVPADIDLVCIAIPAKYIQAVIEECGKKGVKSAVIISAGFKEVGGEGENLEKDLIKTANKYGIKILGPNCLGLMVSESKMNASFAASQLNPGNIAFLSQSGAFCTAILDMSLEKNVGFSHFVSLGNKSDINENEIISDWLADDNVKVIGAYLEEISDGQALLELINQNKKKKPIIIFKPGKTKEAKKAISSHTGSLAGSQETFQAAIKQAGILEASEFNHMFYQMLGFSWSSIPQGKRVAVVTNAGGPGIIATDELVENGLEMAKLTDETKKVLKDHLPATASVNNPIDVIGDALAERYKAPIDILAQDKNVDAILVILTPQLVTQIEDTAKLIINSAKLTNKPIFAVFLGGRYALHGLQRLYDNHVPAFRYINDAVSVLANMYKFGEMQNQRKEVSRKTIIKKYLHKGKYVDEVKKHVTGPEIALPEELSMKLAQEVGISIPGQLVTSNLEEALEFSKDIYPVVIKATSEVIAHKTDDKAIYLNIRSKEDLTAAFKALQRLLKEKFNVEKPEVIIQEMIKSEEELFIGANRDGGIEVYDDFMKGFGHLLAFGKGGIYTEIYKDIGYSLVPARKFDIESAFSTTKISQIVSGARGLEPLAYDKIIETIEAVQKLVLLYPEIVSIDINPLLVTQKDVYAVDVKIFVGN